MVRCSSVRIATRYGLGGQGNESRWGRDFPYPSRPALGPTQPPTQGVPGLSPGSKAVGAWRWPHTPSSAEAKEGLEIYLYSPSGPSWPVPGWPLPYFTLKGKVFMFYVTNKKDYFRVLLFPSQLSVCPQRFVIHISELQRTAGPRNWWRSSVYDMMYGMVWYGMVWYGMIGYDRIWYGIIVGYDIWYVIWCYDRIWYGRIWYIWYGMIGYDIYDMVW